MHSSDRRCIDAADCRCSANKPQSGEITMATFHRRTVLRWMSASLALAVDAASSKTGRAAEQPARPPIKIGQIGVGHGHAEAVCLSLRQTTKLSVLSRSIPFCVSAERRPAFRDLTWMTQEQLLNTPGLQAVMVETRGPRSAQHGRSLHRGGEAHPSRQAGGRVTVAIPPATRRGGQVRICWYRWVTCTATTPRSCCYASFCDAAGWATCLSVHATMSKVVDPAGPSLSWPDTRAESCLNSAATSSIW